MLINFHLRTVLGNFYFHLNHDITTRLECRCENNIEIKANLVDISPTTFFPFALGSGKEKTKIRPPFQRNSYPLILPATK